jgi:DNA-directed RNA polymerase III subunit RPC8
VIQKIGLCIGFYDLLESSDGLIGHGTGLVNVNGMFSTADAPNSCTSKVGTLLTLDSVKFRLIVFRPFKGEIIMGKITGASENGIKGTSLL